MSFSGGCKRVLPARGGKENPQLQQWGKTLATQLLPPGYNGRLIDNTKTAKDQMTDRMTFAMNLAGKYEVSALNSRNW
jgi:hypothetical protein